MIKLYETIFEFHLNPQVYYARAGIWGDMYGKSVFRRFRRIVGVYLKDFYRFATKSSYDVTAPTPKTERWVIIGTRNHSVSLAFLKEVPEYTFVSNSGFPREPGMSVVNWSKAPKLFYLPKYLPFVIKQLICNGRQFIRAVQTVMIGVGEYENAKKALRLKQPKLIVVSNDHTPFYRALTLAARKLSIPVVYIQHACVSYDFPSLIFNLSLLEGQDSYDKYIGGGELDFGTIKLIGMPKLDRFVGSNTRENVKPRIGIPYNLIVSPSTVETLCTQLLDTFPDVEVVVRPHPGDMRPIMLPNDNRVQYSDAATENPFDFIKELSAIIAPNSSICLEAALLDVYPLFYGPMMSRDERANDVYGFQENGLVDFCPDFPALKIQLAKIILNPQSVRDRAKYYCATVGTEQFGRSAELATHAIENYLEERQSHDFHKAEGNE